MCQCAPPLDKGRAGISKRAITIKLHVVTHERRQFRHAAQQHPSCLSLCCLAGWRATWRLRRPAAAGLGLAGWRTGPPWSEAGLAGRHRQLSRPPALPTWMAVPRPRRHSIVCLAFNKLTVALQSKGWRGLGVMTQGYRPSFTGGEQAFGRIHKAVEMLRAVGGLDARPQGAALEASGRDAI